MAPFCLVVMSQCRNFFECRIVTSCASLVCFPACFGAGCSLGFVMLDVVIQFTESFRLHCGCCCFISLEDLIASFTCPVFLISVFRTSCCFSFRLRKFMSGCGNCLGLRCFAGCAGISLYSCFFTGCRSCYRSAIPIMPCIAVFFIAAFVLTCVPVL